VRSVITTPSRNLLPAKIAGYSPGSVVTDHNAIDLDQKFMEIELKKETAIGYINAQAIYEYGGNSKSIAEITLDVNLDSAILKGTEVVGAGIDVGEARGTVYENASSGQKIVKIQYETSSDQGSFGNCRVGALQEGRETSGCFLDRGSVRIGSADHSYTYNPLTHNNNGRTLQGFSSDVQSKMIECSTGCPFTEAQMFVKYYGQPNYGDEWILSAFGRRETDFKNGNADFSLYGDDGLGEVIKKGSVYLNAFMYVIGEFEDAIVNCRTQCDTSNCNDDSVHAWDAGVAFYTGSVEGTDGTPSGYMLHQLADTRCRNFKTCGMNGGLIGGGNVQTRSFVNYRLLREFETGKEQLLNGQCDATELTLRSITKHMYIPLIQGTIRYAYVIDKSSGAEKAKAEGAVFAAAVLPRIHAADPSAAQTIYENMKVGASSTSFAVVKTAFESVYPKLGISCSKIGGLVTGSGVFKEGAERCVNNDDSSDDNDPIKNTDGPTDNDSAGSMNSLIVTVFATVAVIFASA